jgi:twinkle protein
MDIAGSGDITNLADYVISVYRVPDEEKEDEVNAKGKVIREACPYDTMLDLFKNRPLSWQDKTVGLHFDMQSKRFYGDSDDLYKEYGWEKTISSEELMTKVVDDDCPF